MYELHINKENNKIGFKLYKRNPCISKKKVILRPISPRSPCAPDIPGTYNVNSSSGCVRPGLFRPEVKRPPPMRPDTTGGIWMHWRRPFCVQTAQTPPPPRNPPSNAQPLPPFMPKVHIPMLPFCGHLSTATSHIPAPPPDTPARQISSHDTLSPLTSSLASL